MASIQTGIELQDRFSGVIMGIISSVNLAISSMEAMNQSVEAGIDTASLEGAKQQINEATIAAIQLSETFESMAAPAVSQPARMPKPEPISQPITWQSDRFEVFSSSGMERFTQEVMSANMMLDKLSATQNDIARQAFDANILPPSAFQNMNTLATRIDLIKERIQQIENNPLNMGTDRVNSELEQLRLQLSQAAAQQNEMNSAIERMDVQSANSAYLQLSQTISNTERYIRDNVNEQGVFNETINKGTENANSLIGTIKGAIAAYATMNTVKSVLNASDELMQTRSRLNLMNDGLQSTKDLVNMAYIAAQDARGEFSTMASVIARFGNNAKNAFSNSAEVVQFAGLVQKQMTIAGASTSEASNAMLQLSQALGSGVLRGDELNSIFEQAPNIIQNIADYLNVPIGKIREMAADGALSADIVKNAIFAATDDINAKFNSMPMTWGQVWTSLHNTATMAFQPILQRLNKIANSEQFQVFTTNAINAMAMVAGILLQVFELVGTVGQFAAEHWDVLSPIIYAVVGALIAYALYLGITNTIQAISTALKIAAAVASYAHAAATGTEVSATAAATVAQYGFNAALLACPITWIIIGLIALIAVIIAVANHFSGAGHVAQSVFGAICGGINVVVQFFKNSLIQAVNLGYATGKAMGALAENVQIAFYNVIRDVQLLWFDMLSTALTVIESICKALNKLPFISFDFSGASRLASQLADSYAAKAKAAANDKRDYTSIGDAFNKGLDRFDAFKKGWAQDAYKSGAQWGDGVSNKIKNMFSYKGTDIPDPSDYSNALANSNASASDTAANTGQTASNTAKAADSLSATSEDLKYIRDMAETDYINRFTTASITVNQTNNNTINNDMDLDGVTEHLRTTIEDEMNIVAEGVH